jgi:diguanylate cyclase (GGDEF)-like protein
MSQAMNETLLSDLGALSTQRFGSFSEASRAVLSFLECQLPAGRLVLGEFNYDNDEYRLHDVRGGRGEALTTGVRLPLQSSFCLHMAEDRAPALTGEASADPVYGPLDLRRSLAIESYAAAAIELTDGRRVASVCAMSTERDFYSAAHLAVLKVAARLLAYEWERVTREAKLRRLMREQGNPVTADPVTGLPSRAVFLEHLEREWHASQRQITESYAVAVRLEGLDLVRKRGGQAVGDLALRTAAELLVSANRRSDIVARVDDDRFAAILVGCKGIQGAEAYCLRLRAAFSRGMTEQLSRLGVSCRIEALADLPSGTAALERAERRLDEAEAAAAPSAAGGS